MSLTNREAYRAILDAAESTSRSLEEYLRALWLLVRAERHRAQLPAQVFVDLVTGAVVSSVPPFDDAWRIMDLGLPDLTPGFANWERVILSQVCDLRDFAEAPAPDFPELGVDSPRRSGDGSRGNGLRWYNHTVSAYLECAMAGALGGWDAEDGVRKVLPGPTLQIYPEPEGVVKLPSLTWENLLDFLVCGQEYE